MNPVEDEFHEEVLRLFALEAWDWIRQIQASLLELEDGPATQRSGDFVALRSTTLRQWDLPMDYVVVGSRTLSIALDAN